MDFLAWSFFFFLSPSLVLDNVVLVNQGTAVGELSAWICTNPPWLGGIGCSCLGLIETPPLFYCSHRSGDLRQTPGICSEIGREIQFRSLHTSALTDQRRISQASATLASLSLVSLPSTDSSDVSFTLSCFQWQWVFELRWKRRGAGSASVIVKCPFQVCSGVKGRDGNLFRSRLRSQTQMPI